MIFRHYCGLWTPKFALFDLPLYVIVPRLPGDVKRLPHAYQLIETKSVLFDLRLYVIFSNLPDDVKRLPQAYQRR